MVIALEQLQLIDEKKAGVLILASNNLTDKFNLTSEELKKLFPYPYLIEATE